MKSEITRHNEMVQEQAVSALVLHGTLIFCAVTGLIIVLLTSI